MRSRILLGSIFGAIGGFLGFLLQEWRVPHNVGLAMTAGDAARLGMFVGAMLGVAIGAVEGAAVGSSQKLLRGVIAGAVIGAIGGVFGVMFGGQVFRIALFGHDPDMLHETHNILDYTHVVLARALGWTFLGAFPGLAAGAATLSPKRAVHGLVGGLIGGFLGGFAFDLVADTIGQPTVGAVAFSQNQTGRIEIGMPSRVIGFTLIGLFTGFFIGLVEALFRQAWVRVLAGRNEGKDYIISKPLTVLGRDERADVPLFGDVNLAPQHAAIMMENGRHVLHDGGTSMGSIVNGQLVRQPLLLKDGDMIQLGQMRILFREKATANRVGRPIIDESRPALAAGAVAMPSHLCPFCGAQKDAQGGCLCTVPGSTPAALPPPTGFPQPTAYPQPTAALPAAVPAPGGYGQQQYPITPDPFQSGYPQAYGPAYGGGSGSQITALEGPYSGQSFPLMAPSSTIGRDAGRDIALVADTTISRSHAHISQENGQHVIYDDGSSNGTFVNNVRVSVQTLAPGDIIQLGASKFRYE